MDNLHNAIKPEPWPLGVVLRLQPATDERYPMGLSRSGTESQPLTKVSCHMLDQALGPSPCNGALAFGGAVAGAWQAHQAN